MTPKRCYSTQKWPARRITKLVRMYASGKTFDECAMVFGSGPATLKAVYYTHPESRAIRKRLNVGICRRVPVWTDGIINELVTLHCVDEMSFAQIAAIFGRPTYCLRAAFYSARGYKIRKSRRLLRKPCVLHDLTGKRFGRLKVIERATNNRWQQTQWCCICNCGVVKTLSATNLRRGLVRSCGLHKPRGKKSSNFKNGHYTKRMRPLRSCFRSMHQRCNDLENKDYGMRGIRVAPCWSNDAIGFELFLHDMGKRPKGKSLDRTNVDGPYSPDNCRWATKKQQANNKRNSPAYKQRMKELEEMEHAIEGEANVY